MKQYFKLQTCLKGHQIRLKVNQLLVHYHSLKFKI